MNEQTEILTNDSLIIKDKVLPPDSSFLYHRIKVGEKRIIGFTMFEDFYITYSDNDELLLNNLWQSVSENPDSYHDYIDQLSDPFLTSEEIDFVARAAAVVVNLNGRQIGEGIANEEQLRELSQKRIRMYRNTDMNRVVGLNDIKGQGIVMCAEASLIVQGLSKHVEGYHVASANVVSKADSDSAEGHQINFLISDNQERVVLVDCAYGIKKEINGRKILLPYVILLNLDQIKHFNDGHNVITESKGVKRVYRIGTPHTPPGSWKDNHLT